MVRYFTHFFCSFILLFGFIYPADGQNIRRASINALGATSQIDESKTIISQTIGQAYFTATYKDRGIAFFPGFQQAFFIKPKPKASKRDFGKVKIYPNPANDRVRVNPPGKVKDYSIVIRNLNGSIVWIRKNPSLNQEYLEIDVEDWRNGMYLLTLHNKVINKSKSFKLIIQK